MTEYIREFSIWPRRAVYMKQMEEHFPINCGVKVGGAHHRKLRRCCKSCGGNYDCTLSGRKNKNNPSQQYNYRRAKNSLAVKIFNTKYIIIPKLNYYNPGNLVNDEQSQVFHHMSSSRKPKQPRPYNHMKARQRRKTTEPPSALDAPGAPLNTTTDIINSKLNDSLRDQFAPFYGFEYMEELLGLQQTISCQPEKTQSDGEPTRTQEELGSCDLVYRPRPEHGLKSTSLEERISNQEHQIGGLQDNSLVLKERMDCLEEALLGLKRRLSLLEDRKESPVKGLSEASST